MHSRACPAVTGPRGRGKLLTIASAAPIAIGPATALSRVEGETDRDAHSARCSRRIAHADTSPLPPVPATAAIPARTSVIPERNRIATAGAENQ